MSLVPVSGFKTLSFEVIDTDKDNSFGVQAKALGIEFDPSDRIYRSVVQAGVFDRQGERVDQKSFMGAMGDWRDNKGAVLRYYHNPEHIVGRGLMFKGVGFKDEKGDMIDGIEYIGKIDKGNPVSDFVWDGIQNGTIRGSSFSGGHKKGAYIRNDNGGFGLFATDMYIDEISLCPEPVNQFALIMDHNEMAKALTHTDYENMQIDMVKALNGKDVGRIVCKNSSCMVKAMGKDESDHFSEKNVSIKSKYDDKKIRMGDQDMDTEKEIKEMKNKTESISGNQEKSLAQMEALQKDFTSIKSSNDGMEKDVKDMKADMGIMADYMKKAMDEDEAAKSDPEKKDPEDGKDAPPTEPDADPDPEASAKNKGDGDEKGYPETGNLTGKKDAVTLPTSKNGSEEARKLATDPHPQGKGVVGGKIGDMEKALVDPDGNSTFVTPSVSSAMKKAIGSSENGITKMNLVHKSNAGLMNKAEVQAYGQWIRSGAWRPQYTESDVVNMGVENMGMMQ